MVSSLTVYPGDRIALLGESGCGKSTLLDMLALVLMPDGRREGASFMWRGRPESGGKAAKIAARYGPDGPPAMDVYDSWGRADDARRERVRREDLGYVLQAGGLLPFLTVRDNILLPARLKGSPKGKELEERFRGLTADMDIWRLLGSYPDRISMGQRQRVAVARALIHRPALVLADEPTASLDPDIADRVFELLLGLTRAEGIPLILSTHDVRRVEDRRLGFRILRIKRHVAPSGEVRWVLRKPGGLLRHGGGAPPYAF
jgi:putative ABC transport system ATP-binding protein